MNPPKQRIRPVPSPAKSPRVPASAGPGGSDRIGRVGIIGAGHLAGYLLEGLNNCNIERRILVSDCEPGRAAALAQPWGAQAVEDNQILVDQSDLVVLAVRPADAIAACRRLRFRPGQVLASVAAGVPLAQLEPAVAPARAVRVMPISSAAINRSPTLVHPAQAAVQELFALLGHVHVLPDEDGFRAASVISAYYGWIYALAELAVDWCVRQGVPGEVAHPLVLETIRSTADMALAKPQSIRELLDLLATPGGITRHGLGILQQHKGLEAWTLALDGVLERMRQPPA
jgi:pyrroline-5-carboxylate reductase